ncbi:MAG: choice-of-anchor R domain-containing protein, partial [Actinomycetota bacterium]
MVDRSPRLRSRLRPLVVLLVGFTAFAALTPGSATAVNVSLYQHVVNGGWYTTNTARLAQSFATGADAVSVSTVQVFVRNTNESNSSTISGSSYTLAIYTDSSGSPGSLVGTVGSDPSMGAWAEGTSTYTLSTPIELTANTGYFMVMTGTGTASWKYDNTTISTDVTPAPTFRSLRSVNNGSWGSLGVSFSLSISGVAAAPATTTTEPSTTLAPTTAAPTTEPATTAAPTTEPATTAAPTTAAPTTAVPTTEPATTVAPTTATPTTATPTTAAPTTAAPTTAAPTTEAPTTTEPTTTA